MTQHHLSLAQRLLVRVGELSERSDVIVHQQSSSWSALHKKWQEKLPADMFAFYQELNGLTFRYAFTDAPDDWHGLELLALHEGGKKTIDTWRKSSRLPLQAVKRYPKHFFQEGQLDPDTTALFFFGSDDAWGILMSGEGEEVRFHHWDNDGFLRPLGSSFTALIERLIDRGFAHTWAYADTHPITDAVVAQLAEPSPPRATFAITVEAREDVAPEALRRARLVLLSEDKQDKMLSALGRSKEAKGKTAAEKLELLCQACATTEGLDERRAERTMAALGYGHRTLAGFATLFHCDNTPLVRVQLKVTALEPHPTLDTVHYTLVWILHATPELRVTAGFPGPPEVLRFMYPTRYEGGFWTPFLTWRSVVSWTDALLPSTVDEVLLREELAVGLEPGATFTSTGLPCVETRINR